MVPANPNAAPGDVDEYAQILRVQSDPESPRLHPRPSHIDPDATMKELDDLAERIRKKKAAYRAGEVKP